ncbi:MAG: radical SAM protein [Thermoplasmatales archaeon]|nr:radical SAM protein [Thermoplasmatales archaeon]
MFKKRLVPYSTVIELTLECNMNCMHCGSSAGKTRDYELSFDEMKKLFQDLSELGCGLVTCMGGEPFLRKDWYEIMKAIKDYGMNFTVMSNGYNINDEIVKKIKPLQPYAVTVSIDGATAETHDKIRGVKGSFDRCMNALKLLRTADIPTSVITTVHKLNFKEIPDMKNFILNRNIAWQIQIADPIGRFPKKFHLTEKEFYSLALFIATSRKKYGIEKLPVMGAHCIGYHSKVLPNVMLSPRWEGCQAGMSVLGIQSNGNVIGCLSLPDNFVQGNILEKSIKEIWNDSSFCAFNRNFSKEQLKGNCIDCKHGKSCKGGCAAVSISTAGKLHSDPFCLYNIEKQASS